MTCGELDILLCDYLDGTLSAGEARSVETHLENCPVCGEMARDGRRAMAFMERAAEVEPPAQLMTRILHETASGRHGRLGRPSGIRSWFDRSLAWLLQPRLVMGMALTIFSFSMMARCPGISPRQLRQADMDPKKIWAALDDQAHRGWERSLKFYENIKVVYEIQSRLRDWTDQQEEEDRNAAARRPVEERRVPVGKAVSPAVPTKQGSQQGEVK